MEDTGKSSEDMADEEPLSSTFNGVTITFIENEDDTAKIEWFRRWKKIIEEVNGS